MWSDPEWARVNVFVEWIPPEDEIYMSKYGHGAN
jgi:hypothetical protein